MAASERNTFNNDDVAIRASGKASLRAIAKALLCQNGSRANLPRYAKSSEVKRSVADSEVVLRVIECSRISWLTRKLYPNH